MNLRISASEGTYAPERAAHTNGARTPDGGSFAKVLAAMAGTDPDASGMDSVTVSSVGELLSKATLLLPTMENVRKLAAELSDHMGTFFRENGIPTEPPVEFGMDYTTGKVTVTGERSDLDRIEKLVNECPGLCSQVHRLVALSSHAYSLPEHLAFQAEYRASSNPEAVVAKYSHLFGRQQSHEFTVRFDGAAEMFVDGNAWDILGTV